MSYNKNSWHPFIKMRGVFLNIKNKIYLWFLNKCVAKEDEYYGFVEPSVEWMILHNKKFWIRPCNEINEEDVMK